MFGDFGGTQLCRLSDLMVPTSHSGLIFQDDAVQEGLRRRHCGHLDHLHTDPLQEDHRERGFCIARFQPWRAIQFLIGSIYCSVQDIPC